MSRLHIRKSERDIDKVQGDPERARPKLAAGRLFTPSNVDSVPSSDRTWSGFESPDKDMGGIVLHKRVMMMEEVVRRPVDRIQKMEAKLELMKDNDFLRRECCDLKAILNSQEIKVGNNEKVVKQLDTKQKVRRKEQEEKRVNFKKIMESQIKEEKYQKLK